MRTERVVLGLPFVSLGRLFKWVGICLQGGARFFSVSFGGGGSEHVSILSLGPVIIVMSPRTLSLLVTLNSLPLRSFWKVLYVVSRR